MGNNIDHLLRYFELLSNGKIRPDNSGRGGVVRDAKDNLAEIASVKKKINEVLDLDVDYLTKQS